MNIFIYGNQCSIYTSTACCPIRFLFEMILSNTHTHTRTHARTHARTHTHTHIILSHDVVSDSVRQDPPPVIYPRPGINDPYVNVAFGEHLNCSAYGNPEPTITWHRKEGNGELFVQGKFWVILRCYSKTCPHLIWIHWSIFSSAII